MKTMARLFEEVIDQPREVRRIWLETACPQEYSRDIKSLLAAHDACVGESVRTGDDPPARQPTIERWSIVEYIGRGGHGDVYEAIESPPLERIAALKVLRHTQDPKAKSLFLREARALARLSHPGIVRIFDVGESVDGRPYIAMELVDGAPIDEYCERTRATVRERVRLLAQVCRAVSAAHDADIVHRDLKPANVLVCDHKQASFVKLVDFGMALSIPKDNRTERREDRNWVIGTPGYMSPEQRDVKAPGLDARADVYSVGRLLEKLVLDDRGAIPRDIAAIIGNCCHSDRTQRYASAEELAGDLERYLQRRPVRARPSLLYRCTQTVRQHAAVAWAVAAAILLVVLGVFLHKYTLTDARQQAHQAQLLADRIEAFFLDLLGNPADPETGGGDERLSDIARRAARQVGSELQELPQAHVPRMHMTLGRVLLAADCHDEAQRQFELAAATGGSSASVDAKLYIAGSKLAQGDPVSAQALLDSVLDTEPSSGQRCWAMDLMGLADNQLGAYAAGEKHLRAAVAGREQLLGPDDSLTLKSRKHLAINLAEQGLFEEAFLILDDVVERLQATQGPGHRDTQRAMAALASVQRRRGYHLEALDMQRRVLGLQKEYLSPDHPEVLTSVHGLAVILNVLGRHDEAMGLATRAFEGRSAAHGPAHALTLEAMRTEAMTLGHLGDHEARRSKLEAAIQISEQSVGAKHPSTLDSLHALGFALIDLGDQPGAANAWSEVVERSSVGSGGPRLESLFSLGALRYMRGDMEAALQSLQIAYDESRDALRPTHEIVVRSGTLIGAALCELDRASEALPILELCYQRSKREFGEDHRETNRARWGIVKCLIRLNRSDEAIRQLRPVAEGLLAGGGSEAEVQRVVGTLIELLEESGRTKEARLWREHLEAQ